MYDSVESLVHNLPIPPQFGMYSSAQRLSELPILGEYVYD